ncbi:MAG: ATP-dependent Clp protease proteolytic subunit [Actinobacteria bacterium]|nr:ATP-dependent Clp protease proteolytic subunit [Actinomycetota bacterium]
MRIGISEIIFLLFLLALIIPAFQKRILEMRRLQFLHKVEEDRKTRLVTLIHRQKALSFLGIPFARFIDIEDSEQVLRAIRMTDPKVPIDIVMHTPGGIVLASEQIAFALKRHPAKVTVIVPHYAMSGGTLIALAADEIVMDENAVLGPVDPQIGNPRGMSFPASSVIAAAEIPNPGNRDDNTLILADIAKKAIRQVEQIVYDLIKDRMPEEKAREIAKTLSEGRWTHDYPISVGEARGLGLPVSDKLPREFHQLMQLYPQTQQRRPSVEYVPVPYRTRPTRPDRWYNLRQPIYTNRHTSRLLLC